MKKEEVKLKLPGKVRLLLDRLRDHGYEAYVVGGCVRDNILGREPEDWDVTTSAKPDEVKKIFGHTIDTGLQHGTVTVMLEGEGYEVTTYRIDGKYKDGRHPEKVVFTPSLAEDLKRRDFTINALAYNEEVGLVDLYNGLEDMESKLIRCVGEAEERFSEDALRMLRAVRFAAQLDFQMEEKTKAAIRKLAYSLEKISAERIQVELVKLLTSKRPEKIVEAYETHLTKVFLPEFDTMMQTEQNNPHHCYTVGMHTVESIKLVPPDKVLRLTMLFHDMGKPEKKTTDEDGIDHFRGHAKRSAELSRRILRRLKFDNDTIRQVSHLVLYHDDKPEPTKKNVRRLLNRVGKENFKSYLQVQYADLMAQSEYKREEKLVALKEYERLYEEIVQEKECVSLKELEITGRDLILAGIPTGPGMGEVLNSLLEIVLEKPDLNQKEILISLAMEMQKSCETKQS